MQPTIDRIEEKRIIVATTTGTVTRKDAVAIAAHIALHLQGSQFGKFLVDHRSARVQMGVVDLYYLLTETEAVGLGRQYVGAIVFARDTDHDFQFYEWRAMNEGFRRRMFTDIEAAIAWLDLMPER